MSKLIVEYRDSGAITEWRYEADDEYTPDDNELEAAVDHRTLKQKRVDTAGDAPALVDDPDFEPTPDVGDVDSRLDTVAADVNAIQNGKPVQRAKVTDSQKQTFRDARSAGDLQTQIDTLFEIVTGEQP